VGSSEIRASSTWGGPRTQGLALAPRPTAVRLPSALLPPAARFPFACLPAGNLVFVLSYAWRSLPVLLLARLLNGLGSARAANRRYTADFVSRARRTMASAGAGPDCLRLCRHCSICQSGAG
jgi:hypothetical protein